MAVATEERQVARDLSRRFGPVIAGWVNYYYYCRFYRELGEDDEEMIVTLNLAEHDHARGNTDRAVDLVKGVLP